MFFSSSDAWTIDCEKKIDGSESNESNGTSCVRKRKKLISVFKYVFLAPPLSNGCPPPSVHPKAKTPINTDLPWILHQIKILYGEKKKKILVISNDKFATFSQFFVSVEPLWAALNLFELAIPWAISHVWGDYSLIVAQLHVQHKSSKWRP